MLRRLSTNNSLQTKETLMYRSLGMAVIALAAISLTAETSLAFGLGGRAGKSGWPGASVAAVPAKSRGTATPAVKKLSPKAGAACFRSCMHGVSGAGWGNFCDSACYGN
jgi:hypothetical protein